MNPVVIEFLKNEIEFCYLVRQPILGTTNNLTVGYNAYLKNKNNISVAGGTAPHWESALRIGVAEGIERAIFNKIRRSNEQSKLFFIDQYPTTCGFAAGFDNEKTKYRAIAEALERWVWSWWIDKKYIIPEVSNQKIKENLSDLSLNYYNMFEHSYGYQKDFLILLDGIMVNFRFYAFIGIYNNGVFPGSRVTIGHDSGWNHAIIESYRNLNNFKIYKKNPEYFSSKDNFVFDRCVYFGQNKLLATNSITEATYNSWPIPEILMLEQVNNNIPNGSFVWRCLFKDFIGWHLGDNTRFVY